jgi:hypothetical protein
LSRLLKNFFLVLAWLAGVVGLYMGALSVKLVWAFWLTVPAAVLIAILLTYGRRLFEWANRVKNYPVLVKEAADERVRAERVETQLARLTKDVANAYGAGLEEGARRVYGGIRAMSCQQLDVVAAVAHNGTLAIIATGVNNLPMVGARYEVVSTTMKTPFGVVEVREVDVVRKRVILPVVDATSAPFWEHLSDRVGYDESPPANVTLRPAAMPSVRGAAVETPERNEDGQELVEAEVGS